MLKKTIVAALVVLFGINAMAQTVQEATVQVGTLTVPAYTLSVEKDVKLVQNALNQRFKDAKLKTKSSEGYQAVIDQLVPEISTVPVNLYTKVEEQGKKKNRVTVVTMCAITTDLTIDQNTLRANVRSYLEGFTSYLARYEANQNMQAEQKNLRKKIADKQNEIKKLQEKIKDLEKDIADLEKRIEKNSGKKVDAERKVEEAKEGVSAKQGEVERYRQMAE